MNDAEKARTWELMSSLTFCMLTSWNGEILRSRPMGAFVRREENAVYFFTDVRADKDDEIERCPQVCLAFADVRKQRYVSVSGTAEVIEDFGKVKELWSIPAKVWWQRPDNPNLRLIKVTPSQAEIWDTPGQIVSNFKVALALLRGTTPNHDGEHVKVAF